jgi:hypothetical protein
MSASFRSTTPYTALPYPPSGVGGEAEASVGVELLNSLHKPYVALTDEVFEGKLIATISFGHRYHQAKVLLDELLLSLLVARTSLLGEDYLLAVGKETILAYLRQITGQQLRRFESTWGSGFGAPLWRERGL